MHMNRNISIVPQQLIYTIRCWDLLRTWWPRDIPSHHQRQRIFLLPLNNGIKASTLMIHEEIGERPVLCLHPIESLDVRISRTHNVLHQHICAVRDMNPMQVRKRLLAMPLIAIIFLQTASATSTEPLCLLHSCLFGQSAAKRSMPFVVYYRPTDTVSNPVVRVKSWVVAESSAIFTLTVAPEPSFIVIS
jgi:hypothetical protein